MAAPPGKPRLLLAPLETSTTLARSIAPVAPSPARPRRDRVARPREGKGRHTRTMNTGLILAHSAPPADRADEDKATNDLDRLREEFRKRPYIDRGARLVSQQTNGIDAR